MPKKATQIVCSKKELDALTILANGRKVEKRLAERAKIVLLCHEGLRNDTISKKLQTTVMTVAKWRNRFNKDRIEGLKDKTRSGKPKKYDESIRNNILKLIEQPVPRGQSSWDGKSISKRLGISHDIVWRILRKEGIQLQRMRSWCVSTDKEFAAKAVEIWFGILTRKALRGASFSSTDELKKAIGNFVNVYSKNAKPFIWKKREVKGSQLKNTITNLCN